MKHRTQEPWYYHLTFRNDTPGQVRLGWTRFGTWFEAVRYHPRHRGVYDWFIGTSLGARRMGELRIQINADLRGFSKNALRAIENIATYEQARLEAVRALRGGFLGTKPDAPWVVWRE